LICWYFGECNRLDKLVFVCLMINIIICSLLIEKSKKIELMEPFEAYLVIKNGAPQVNNQYLILIQVHINISHSLSCGVCVAI
jgi:hypothetical protein